MWNLAEPFPSARKILYKKFFNFFLDAKLNAV